MDHAHDGTRVIDSADPEHALPVRSTNETCAFPFAGTAAKPKTEFSIKVQNASAGASPCDVLGPGLPSDQNKRSEATAAKCLIGSRMWRASSRAGRVVGTGSHRLPALVPSTRAHIGVLHGYRPPPPIIFRTTRVPMPVRSGSSTSP